MNWLKKLFGIPAHRYICESRKFVGFGTRDCSIGTHFDIQETKIYITKHRCIDCGHTVIDRQEILSLFDRSQPYDN